MKYNVTFPGNLYSDLIAHLFSDSSVEQAAYLLCKISRTEREIRFLVREVIVIPTEILVRQERDLLSIPSDSYVPIFKKATDTKHCFFLVHSHPEDFPNFSIQDDNEEKILFSSAYNRIELEGTIHGSLVFNSPNTLAGRVWLEEKGKLVMNPIELLRVVGKNYKFIKTNNSTTADEDIRPFFDRHVLAFGKEIQNLLHGLHIGVVGCGGTGSAVIEQLTRLGVGELTVIDGDTLSKTNVTRVHGSGLSNEGTPKVELIKNMVEGIGFGTLVNIVDRKIVYKDVAKELRDCDLIFGCTDDQAGRAVLNQIAIRYYIPLIDMGVFIDSDEENYMRSIPGRITIVHPETSCLLCKGWVKPNLVQAQLLSDEEYEARRREGYAPALKQTDPSVITFTTAIAALAINEMLNLLTGFMADDLPVTDMIYCFDYRRVSIRPEVQKECMCNNAKYRGRGDTEIFLEMYLPEYREG